MYTKFCISSRDSCDADVSGWRALHFAGNDHLVVLTMKLSTVGDRTCSTAASHIWNSLPDDVVSTESLSSFHWLVKTFLFRRSFPDIAF